ncbi:MAG TPA: hypothetical protein VHV10_14275, partial [Ktedonobacteraceae bacterium]|nr:hypothetical protein [Ktedonobacteraceae bacterium]
TDVNQKSLADFVCCHLQPLQEDGKIQYSFTFTDTSDNAGEFQRSLALYRDFYALKKRVEHTTKSYHQLPQVLFIALVNTYNTYIGSLAEAIFHSGKSSAEELKDGRAVTSTYKSSALEMAPDRNITRELASVQPLSCYDQISWLESRFNIPLEAELCISNKLGELIERRNCHVFGQGTVSSQYLDFCRQHNISTEGIDPGDVLEVTAEYFCAAHNAVYEIGLKVGYFLWCNAVPEQATKANAALQEFTFSLIQAQRYKLARRLLQFANTSAYKYADENNRHVFLINGALAAYLDGDRKECNRIVASTDWSTTFPVLELASLVLTEQFNAAAELMRKIGREARPSKGEYLRWPLFQKFRQTPEFTSAFRQIFGTPLTLNEADINIARKSASA